jgi:glycosyltransferase involved in cell wall biosynthesis
MPLDRARVRPFISIVIPAFNEARNIASVLDALPPVDEVIVVDGGSSDGTAEAARSARPDVVIIQQSRRGKGNALAAGFEAARGDYIVMLDADGSMDPAEIEVFIAALDRGADFVKGSRFLAGGGSADISRVRNVGNAALNRAANALFGTRYTDLCYGYNAFRRDCRGALDLPDAHDTAAGPRWGDGFEIETLMNVRVAVADKTVHEVPSFEHARLHGESHLRTYRDGTRVLATLIKERVGGRRPLVAPVPSPVLSGVRSYPVHEPEVRSAARPVEGAG